MNELRLLAALIDHGTCRSTLEQALNRAGEELEGEAAEVTISTAPPIIDSVWTQPIQCPHGVTFWIEPTGDQRARWAAMEGQK